jgi:hypothetical protein
LAECGGEIMTKQGGVQAARDCPFVKLGRLSHLALLFQQVAEIYVRDLAVRTVIKRAAECLLSFRCAAKQLQG